MIPKKIFWMLGYNNLSLILDQERKHWLMKTDKKKQVQDKTTGDLFQSQIDNIGSDIIIETEKLPYKFDFIPEIKFNTQNVDYILEVANSAFPHSAMVNGLMFTRIKSTMYPYEETDGSTTYKHYKIKFTDAKECTILFSASIESNEVYTGRWIRTTTNPTLMFIDDQGKYSLTKEFIFSDNVNEVVYYYPLSDTLQPVGCTDLGNGTYELDAINDDGLIGYPLFWFTSSISNVGSNLIFGNNVNSRNEQIFFVSNEGTSSKFNAKVYTGIDGNNDATPDGTATSNYTIECSCKNGITFENNDTDFGKSINVNSIYLVNNTTQTRYNIPFICNDTTDVKMSTGIPWEYVNESTYSITMEYFDQNCLNISTSPLVSIFDVHFDESIPFVKTSSDVGYSGIRMSSSLSSDIYNTHPHNINKWEGLPEWITNDDGHIPDNLMMYSIHQTPSSDPTQPDTMQGAGLILDPGKILTSERPIDDEGNPIINNEDIGRVYVLSNDDLEYRNNSLEDFPKPARTAARICDIPTSVMQLSGTTGLSPDPIVDKKYVRTEAMYTEADKNRLYNVIASRWVKPTALTVNGNPVHEELGFNNKFAFESYIESDGTFVNTLEAVDLIDHNNFRYIENLNPYVDVSKIHISNISSPGKNYNVNDTGVTVVGGYSFTYIVEEVDDVGGVTKLSLVPDDRASSINLSNFDMSSATSEISAVYGTSPTSGNGSGLKYQFYIEYEYYQSIITKKGDVFDDLFAFVREPSGLYVYQYQVNKNSSSSPKAGKWVKGQCISEYEITSIDKKNGGVSTSEAYINSILPSVRDLPISLHNNNEDPTTIVALQTASFINVIDKNHTPVDKTNTDKTVVDMCKFYCDGVNTAIASVKTTNGIKDKLTELNMLRFDSYVLWRWVNTEDIDNKEFEYAIVYRSFNNLFTTDEITMLTENKLRCDNFVHTNANTTIVWDVEGVGVMMWVYDPSYNKKEEYYIDPETMELHVTRNDITYADIDIRPGSDGNIPEIVDINGRYKFNIMTNNPISIDDNVTSPIYQQPDMTQLDDAMIGQFMSATSKEHMLCGNWKLVFPRVQSFKLKNDKTNTEWIPMKMQTIKGRSISDIGTVNDQYGNDVSTKSIIINEDVDGISLNMFNSKTGKWEKI